MRTFCCGFEQKSGAQHEPRVRFRTEEPRDRRDSHFDGGHLACRRFEREQGGSRWRLLPISRRDIDAPPAATIDEPAFRAGRPDRRRREDHRHQRAWDRFADRQGGELGLGGNYTHFVREQALQGQRRPFAIANLLDDVVAGRQSRCHLAFKGNGPLAMRASEINLTSLPFRDDRFILVHRYE